MLTYWTFFLSISFFSLNTISVEKNLKIILKIFFIILLSIFIGLRHEVGGDWDIYKFDFKNNLKYFNLFPLEYVRDFGYEFISYLSNFFRTEIYGVNLILAIIFVLSLNKLAITYNDNYWIIFIIAFPYLITVVAMGFTRQATAFAFFLFALSSLKNKNILLYFLYTFLALLFHKSSAILIPMVFLSFFKFNIKFFTIFLFLSSFSYFIINAELPRILGGYVQENSLYQSKGVNYRIALNLLAGFVFIVFYKKIKIQKNIDLLIFVTFFVNLFLLFFVNDYSVFVDRLIIYFTFMQLLVYSRIYLIYPEYKILFNILIILMYIIVYYTWFNYSYHSNAWVPYKNLLF